MSAPKNEAFGYTEFGQWYDAYRAKTLEPALELAMNALDDELVDQLSDRDIARIRNLRGRVKSKRRTWRKLRQPRYQRQIATVEQIPGVIDDLIGMRITCTNLRDLAMVEGALDNLPRHPGAANTLGLDPASERDYVDAPKDSGYRGWHVNLSLSLEQVPVTCELQIRTVLQDSWGELTHEDTYSKDGALPPLVEVLSKRMADLLATLDDIAEDLRTELDRIDEAVVAGPSDGGRAAGEEPPLSAVAADAAELLRERWRNLGQPVELASLAWSLQKEFGAEVSDDWFGHRSFKRFLLHVIPDGEISSGRQAFLLPATQAPDPKTRTSNDGAIPDEAHRLRRIDRGFPVIETERWTRIYAGLAAAHRQRGPGTPSTQMINQLTRSARDRAAAGGDPLSRRHLDYVAKAVLAGYESEDPLTAEQIAERFSRSILQRMTDEEILDHRSGPRHQTMARWLAAPSP